MISCTISKAYGFKKVLNIYNSLKTRQLFIRNVYIFQEKSSLSLSTRSSRILYSSFCFWVCSSCRLSSSTCRLRSCNCLHISGISKVVGSLCTCGATARTGFDGGKFDDWRLFILIGLLVILPSIVSSSESLSEHTSIIFGGRSSASLDTDSPLALSDAWCVCKQWSGAYAPV